MVFFTSDGSKQLSNHFKVREFSSKDGFPIVCISSELVEKLQQLRNAIGKPVIINSAYRSPEHNKAVGGATKSRHMLGCAADIVVRGMSPAAVAQAAKKIGFTGIIEYPKQGFTHVDVGRASPYYAVSK